MLSLRGGWHHGLRRESENKFLVKFAPLPKFQGLEKTWISACSFLPKDWATSCWALVIFYLEDNLPGTSPIGQESFKSYLPSKKIYLSWTAGRVFSSPALGPIFLFKVSNWGLIFLRIEVARKSKVTPRERTFWLNKHLKWSGNAQ